MSTELRSLFGPREQSSPVPSSSQPNSCPDDSLLSRAGRLCQQLRPGKKISCRKNVYKPYHKRPVGKEIQKRLVLIDYQGDSPGEIVAFWEYQKLYDGSIRYRLEMSEDDIRQEIVRLLRQKESITHSLEVITPNDFDFVRCANRRVRRIDGDAPFDGAGISQVYSNGAIYIRLNSLLLEKRNVSVYYANKIFPMGYGSR